jgi:hypothetical protein
MSGCPLDAAAPHTDNPNRTTGIKETFSRGKQISYFYIHTVHCLKYELSQTNNALFSHEVVQENAPTCFDPSQGSSSGSHTITNHTHNHNFGTELVTAKNASVVLIKCH